MEDRPQLDRLTALLHGVAPRVEHVRVSPSGLTLAIPETQEPLLHVHLLEGLLQLEAQGQLSQVSHPAFWICRGDTAHRISASTPQALDAVVSFKVHLDGPVAPLLLADFAQPKFVALNNPDTLLTHVIALVRSELQVRRWGQPTLLNRAGDILFIGLMRHLVAQTHAEGSLFSGLSDMRIAAALVAMHEAPEHPWTLESLSQRAGMSRTAFAVRFKCTTNRAPGKYLKALRIQIAQRAVKAGLGLKAAARASGYNNVSALSRVLGRSQPDQSH